jgi:hypothetical protein
MSYTELSSYFKGAYNIFNVSYYLYKYNLLFYVIYLLLVKRSYLEAFFIIYNLFR